MPNKNPANPKMNHGDFYIMVVDNEQDFLDSICYWFTSQGYRVEALTSGAEALAKIREKKPGVIFINIQMPQQEGLTTLSQIKDIAADVPVIMLSAFGSEDMSIDAFKMGVNGFFDKSSNFYQAEHLMNTLVRVVSRKRRPETFPKREKISVPQKPAIAVRRRFPWLWLLGLVILICAFFVFAKTAKPSVCFGKDVCLRVELAETEAQRQKGLMYRNFLPQKDGMFFIFPQEGFWGFWMKNTKIPLDIIWLDAQGRVVSMARGVQPDASATPAVYKNNRPAKFVLETNAGFVDRYGIKAGDKAVFPL